MTKDVKELIAICLIALLVAALSIMFAVYASERKIDYDIAKSCAKNKAFQIKGVHYYCVEIEEQKK